ncbi:MAG TPA: CopD family protein [Labilithrix sp.]|jgi:copper transport protein
MEQAHALDWMQVALEYVGFVSSFFLLGPIGFRWGIVRTAPDATAARALRDAAIVGLAGVALGVVSLVASVSKRAEAKHLSFGDAFAAGGATVAAQAVLLGVLLVCFALAWRGAAIAWKLAGAGALAFALRGVLGGRLGAMVNPLHVLGASVWLGTLFVLVFCGVREQLRDDAATREPAVAQMVHRFSVVALGGAGLLGVTGIITSWTHLKHLDALWTTPYGQALFRKLVVVLGVVGLGAWNWRRVGPALGRDGGAVRIRRSAIAELAVAALVLLLTAILVSTPSPKFPPH